MTINRLDPEHLREWRKNYEEVRASYIRGHISRLDLGACLEHLGFRQDALKAEIIDAVRDKNNPRYQHPRAPRFYTSDFSLSESSPAAPQ